MTKDQCIVGCEVIYQSHEGARFEYGVITRMGPKYPFVEFVFQSGAKATPVVKLRKQSWIRCAAIRRDVDGEIWSLPRPARHADIIYEMKSGKNGPRVSGFIGDSGLGGFTQGFLTGGGTFVDRQQAARIAGAARQLIASVRDGVLTTDEMW